MVAIQTGRLYGIGVGPGDPELLTLKAYRLLQAAPVVAYQAASDRESIARSIVAPYLKGDQIEVCFNFPRALDPEAASELYSDAIKPIEAHLGAGRDVVVLCAGDPLFYGSFMYLFTRLAARFITEIVPGISSPMAAAAAIGTPLCYQNDVFSVLAATLSAADLKAQLINADAVAIIKLRRHFDKVRQVLIELDLLDRAKYIERATAKDQRIVSIEDVDSRNVPYFSLIVVPSKTQF
ncbi:precorrin-2 C(20)-methyltransferase [Chamaesiphon minutus]|uniref:Precorrin-2 C20-methyltransferase n=1 Tax=Chamaesiphon minutus (strain ATCC 27169 / PCC 6605) TaxID=1173020 RepID=K9UMY8_CHAP6|nr:precorrin-2 C(20)-methyltransferase [Chamaesiphon minutus]AFY96038.1 precorrin-2 C20-methyltransferase [Chamaesiphon minutus PCC 6605]